MKSICMVVAIALCVMLKPLFCPAGERDDTRSLIFRVFDTEAKMTQEIEVKENSSFNVVTTVGDTRWAFKGTTGKVTNGWIRVDFNMDWRKGGSGVGSSGRGDQLRMKVDGSDQRVSRTIHPDIWASMREIIPPK